MTSTLTEPLFPWWDSSVSLVSPRADPTLSARESCEAKQGNTGTNRRENSIAQLGAQGSPEKSIEGSPKWKMYVTGRGVRDGNQLPVDSHKVSIQNLWSFWWTTQELPGMEAHMTHRTICRDGQRDGTYAERGVTMYGTLRCLCQHCRG